jgi:TrpR-related protein YerC/YecD
MTIMRVKDSDPDDLAALATALSGLDAPAVVEDFLRDLCTVSELDALGHRLHAARLLADTDLPYLEIARIAGTSTTTVTRVAHWLRHGNGGYAAAIERLPALPESPTRDPVDA